MNEIDFAVLGTGGIGRRTLEVSQHKEHLRPVAACDRNGIAIDRDGLDVEELLDATEGNIAGDGRGDTGGPDAANRRRGNFTRRCVARSRDAVGRSVSAHACWPRYQL